MANQLCVNKISKSKTRKLPFLPRIGLTFEIGNRQIVFRSAPLLETFLNVWQRGLSPKNLMDVGLEELSEINLPQISRPDCKPSKARKKT